MALIVKDEEIVGTINDIHSMNGIGLHDNLQEKLNGKLPVDRVELLYLINSWGRSQDFSTSENILIPECGATQCYDLSKLDTSEITDMNGLFKYSMFNNIHSTNGIGLHNGDISNWDVSKVTDMSQMFYAARNFNQALNNWDVSSVKDMSRMFFDAKKFNQALNNWDVSNATDMKSMFAYAWNFNQALNNWDVSNVTDMSFMFFNVNNNFNQDINNWNVSSVTNMSWMFAGAINFNQHILWDLSNVEISGMFRNAWAFEKKFNNKNPLPNDTNELKVWFNNNRDKMLAIDIKEREKDNLDSFYNNLESLYNNLDKENMH